MTYQAFYRRYRLDKSLEEQTGFNPYYHKIRSGLSHPVLVDGESFMDLASNNYLGLAADPRVKAAAVAAVEKYGASLCGTPVATGYSDLFHRVEERLARFVGLDAAILLPSCYQANNGLFFAIAGKEDLIVIDHDAHSSLIQGARAAGCRIRPFLHHDVQHLTGILEKSRSYRQVFVVTESVFSTDGTIAPWKEIVRVAEKYHAVPVVDDSHGIGVIGKGGGGILEEAGTAGYPGIYTASLGKALANSGGMIAGKKELIDYLRYYCPHLVYSTALPPAVLGGIDKVLDLVEEDFFGLSRPMWHNKDLLSQCLFANGFPLTEGQAPITSICTGSAADTIRLAQRFYENRVLTTPFIPPAVPPRGGKVRLIAGGGLPEAVMDQVLAVIEKMGRER